LSNTTAHLDAPGRIAERLGRLAELSAGGEGVTRLAYTALERRAHELMAEWIDDLGGRVETDAAGNTVGVFNDGEPYFLVGSHLDTVVHGGAFDGAAGVVGALEVAAQLRDGLEHGLRIVAFAAEEGARFGRPNIGSSAAAGFLDATAAADLVDSDGISLADAAAAVELAPHVGEPWIDSRVACFFEIHIEQGRQLELGAAQIGLVDAIAGSLRMRFRLVGRADHSGATPMELRADALAGASEIILGAERVAREYRATVATVGRLEVRPNNVTTVAGEVTAWIDVRDVDADQQRRTAQLIADLAHETAEQRELRLTLDIISVLPPVVLAAWPRALARAECELRALPCRVMPSGAGHDAAIVARRAPAALYFVPCRDGVSHSPAERADPRDIAAAVDLLVAVVRRADRLSL
jgi:allantoate deiminase